LELAESIDSNLEEVDGEYLNVTNSYTMYNPDFIHTPLGKKALDMMPSRPPQLLSLAQWAFGPSGLPELQILAYGDFSYDGRYEWQNRLFCRSKFALDLAIAGSNSDCEATLEADLTFREVTKTDLALMELLEEHSDMLSACPEDKILYNYY
jgi:hypothetical protein